MWTMPPAKSTPGTPFAMDGTTPVNGRPFVEFPGPGGSDGIRTDGDGNLWAAAAAGGAGFDGVHCYSPDGTLLGRIHLPESCANLCFGGPKKNRLFMTATSSLYSVYVEALRGPAALSSSQATAFSWLIPSGGCGHRSNWPTRRIVRRPIEQSHQSGMSVDAMQC